MDDIFTILPEIPTLASITFIVSGYYRVLRKYLNPVLGSYGHFGTKEFSYLCKKQ